MVKSWRIITALLLCIALVSSISCNPFGGSEADTDTQYVDVVRDDLIVSVSGSGNIEVSNEIDLTFGVGGKINKIYVKYNYNL